MARKKQTVSGVAKEFVRRAEAGHKLRLSVAPERAAQFVAALVGEGIEFANDCLDHIRDARMREAIRTVLVTGAAGACLGAAIGGAVAGPAGAALGAAIGAGVGVLVGGAAVVTFREGPDGRLVVATR